MLPDISPVHISHLAHETFERKEVSVSVLRIDQLHPVVSGNKLYKLKFFLEEALCSNHKTLLTFGGAYSNHLVATAFAGQQAGLRTTGVVRGEKGSHLSPTLKECLDYGMELQFLSRKDYRDLVEGFSTEALHQRWGAFTLVPEGGYHPLGAAGATDIARSADLSPFTHICTALGTATTAAGLLMATTASQTIVGIPVLKGMRDIPERIRYLTGEAAGNRLLTWPDAHWGGYAKKNDALLAFMNQCWQQFQLPLDFVYTARMFHAVVTKISEGFFPPGSRVLCVHTGGLQGNRSLPAGALVF